MTLFVPINMIAWEKVFNLIPFRNPFPMNLLQNVRVVERDRIFYEIIKKCFIELWLRVNKKRLRSLLMTVSKCLSRCGWNWNKRTFTGDETINQDLQWRKNVFSPEGIRLYGKKSFTKPQDTCWQFGLPTK